jgi:hypothetical protein
MRHVLTAAIVRVAVAAAFIGAGVFLATLGGCKVAAKTCPAMAANTSSLLQQAAVVRLDIYGGGAQCKGDTLAPGAPAPTESQTVSAGKSLTIDVPAGHHVLLLSAFRDDAASVLLGSACTETNVVADQPACFDLKLAAVPDASMPFVAADMAGAGPGPDLATLPGDLSQFIPCSASPDNCPAGQYCAATGSCVAGCKVDLDCAGTPSTPRCLVAAHTCVACLANGDCGAGKICSPSNTCTIGCDPKAPNCPSQEMCCSDLCIDTTSDVDNCGGCGHACSLTQAVAKCASNACAVKQCNPGYSDCNGTASDGCECPDLGDASHGCCAGGACETSHGDGFGQSFVDCFTLGTYNEDVALDAANAYNKNGAITDGTCAVPGNQHAVCDQLGSECVCFTYADSAGGVYVGRARRTLRVGDMGQAQCQCANNDSGDVKWK